MLQQELVVRRAASMVVVELRGGVNIGSSLEGEMSRQRDWKDRTTKIRDGTPFSTKNRK